MSASSPAFCVGKVHHELIDDAVAADRAADRGQTEIGGIEADEVVFVEALERVMPDAARHDRDMIDIGFGHHRGHGRVNVARLELVARVRFPQGGKAICRHCQVSSLSPSHGGSVGGGGPAPQAGVAGAEAASAGSETSATIAARRRMS
jgi:hypothetical protein